jgi:site-specific DNA-methyltransferase (adenine-specific)
MMKNNKKTKHKSSQVDSLPTEDSLILRKGDCLKYLEQLASGSVDLVLVDLPYGTTACPWDSVIPLVDLWIQLKRVGKNAANFVFTAQQPFTWALAASNPSWFKYELIWEKPNGTNPFQARRMPMKRHENILVFYEKAGTYNPQMTEGRPYKWSAKRSKSEAGGMARGKDAPIDNKGTRYPTSVLRFAQERGLHPTQKPVALMEWLIRTYSNEGETVLDCCMGSASTGVAALKTGRKFVGIEKDPLYYELAVNRLSTVEAAGVSP